MDGSKYLNIPLISAKPPMLKNKEQMQDVLCELTNYQYSMPKSMEASVAPSASSQSKKVR